MNSLKIIFGYFYRNPRQKYLLSYNSPISLIFQHYCKSALNELIRLSADVDYCKVKYSEALCRVPRSNLESDKNEPNFLKYIQKENINEDIDSDPESNCEEENSQLVSFPYQLKKEFSFVAQEEEILAESFPKSILNLTPSDNVKVKVPEWESVDLRINTKNWEDPKKWAVSDDSPDVDILQSFQFGTCDPSVPVSSIPCGGCGALLHCTDMSIPGFLPKEAFLNKSDSQLRSEICQRCNFLKEFDVALGVNISPDEYPKIISSIKDKVGLVILVVDLLDFPCSIWPGIIDLIGPSKQIVVVGNKVDLFIQEGSWFLKQLKESLISSLEELDFDMQRIKDIHLLSAKTGYGIEALITKLHKNWGVKGDVYIVGCTNVGKSTLFNCLIQSDYCKVKATEIMHRATISAWPGTTLNLLKFPITKPSGWKHAVRIQRLMEQKKNEAALKKVSQTGHNIRLEQIPLKGYVVQTLGKNTHTDTANEFNSNEIMKPRMGLNPNDSDLKGRWCYDTPGVVHHDQIVNLLTTSELLLTVPKNMLIPRNFHMNPGCSLFIGGLARLDYVKGFGKIWFTVYASKELPITITETDGAEDFYNKFLGSPILRVPFGGKERLEKWPQLRSKKFDISGVIPKTADADIVLSSAGWVSVKIHEAHRCTLEAWTPEGRGIHLRKLPVIKFGHTFKGARIQGTPAFKVVMKEVKGYSLTDKPPY